MTGEPARKPHAALEQSSRTLKARKIERLLAPFTSLSGKDILEVGTGAGHIARYLSDAAGSKGSMTAVDVVDQRQEHQGYDFHLVTGTGLPFDDNAFDIVVSNHVVEHVGEQKAQLHHLVEIRRVLRADGWLYLAVPNRWALIEPHYRLAFLSWLPTAARSSYLRLRGGGDYYDCHPPSLCEARRLFKAAGFAAADVSIKGISVVGELEYGGKTAESVLRHASTWARPMMPIFPSYLFVAQSLDRAPAR